MKFRDKKTGEVYENIFQAHVFFCKKMLCDQDETCSKCPLSFVQNGTQISCSNFINRHLEQAAEIMGLEIVEDTAEKPTRQSILEEARRCVCGDRDQQYGSPENSFRMIAELWEPYLRERCVSKGADVTIRPEDVAIMMALFKIARICTGTAKQDSFVDCCGYMACAGEIGGR